MSTVDRKAPKPILKVREKASDVKMFSRTIINKDLTNNRKKAYRTISGSDLSPSFLKTGSTDEDFQQEGKQDSAKHLLYSLQVDLLFFQLDRMESGHGFRKILFIIFI